MPARYEGLERAEVLAIFTSSKHAEVPLSSYLDLRLYPFKYFLQSRKRGQIKEIKQERTPQKMHGMLPHPKNSTQEPQKTQRLNQGVDVSADRISTNFPTKKNSMRETRLE